jgi:UDP-glucose 4-epimerase
MKRILVTGGAGYIGSITSKILSDEGYVPVIFDNLENGYRQAVGDFEFIQGDLRNYFEVDAAFKAVHPDAVVHFAALKAPGDSMKHPEEFYTNNVGGSANLCKAMIDNSVDKVVFSSTCAVYGTPQTLPVDEQAPFNPESVYGHSKLQVEQMLEWFAKLEKISSVRLRYFNVAGALEDGTKGEDAKQLINIIPLLMKAALGQREFTLYGNDYATPDGTNVRDYIHVVDLAHAHVKALEYLNTNKGSEYFNVGVGEGYSNYQVIDMVHKVIGREIPITIGPRRAGDPTHIFADNSKARKKLDWEPQYGLREIIEHAWKWHSTHPNGYE